MLVDIVNAEGEIVDQFKISFFEEVEREGRKRIQSGSVDWGYSFKVGKHQWNVVEAIGGSLEIEKVEFPRDPEE